jgi:hypothetical protein
VAQTVLHGSGQDSANCDADSVSPLSVDLVLVHWALLTEVEWVSGCAYVRRIGHRIGTSFVSWAVCRLP